MDRVSDELAAGNWKVHAWYEHSVGVGLAAVYTASNDKQLGVLIDLALVGQQKAAKQGIRRQLSSSGKNYFDKHMRHSDTIDLSWYKITRRDF